MHRRNTRQSERIHTDRKNPFLGRFGYANGKGAYLSTRQGAYSVRIRVRSWQKSGFFNVYWPIRSFLPQGELSGAAHYVE